MVEGVQGRGRSKTRWVSGMVFVEGVALLAAGVLAGVANSLAGGGTFFSFPVFMALGLPPVIANASNALAVLPAHPLAAWRERDLLRQQGLPWRWLGLALLGGVLGAALLQQVGNAGFARLIAPLLGLATLLFALGPWLVRHVQRVPGLAGLSVLAVSVYGGFFSAGLGVMMMAALQLAGLQDLRHNNAVKNLLAALVSAVAVWLWAWQGLIALDWVWPALLGSWLGGVLGGRWAQRIPLHWLRRGVIGMGAVLTGYYAVRQWMLA